MMLSQRVAVPLHVSSVMNLPIKRFSVGRQQRAPITAVRNRSVCATIYAQHEDKTVLRLQGPQTIIMPTLFAKGPDGKMMKANVVIPPKAGTRAPQEGDKASVKARGVVLFLHGYAQGPTAYARMLTQLAADDYVIIAPCPAFDIIADKQQTFMVDAALFWRNLIATNKLPSLVLEGATANTVGLVGHSVGGGLAAYVADAAARNGQAFAAAHVMAPQTDRVVDNYRFDVANGGTLLQGVPTVWGVQYGLLDLLSWPHTVNRFSNWLRSKDTLRSTVKYELGTHVGFEDQLVIGRESFTQTFLPVYWALALLWGSLSMWLPAFSLLSAAQPSVPDDEREGTEGLEPANEGFGAYDDVDLPDERVMFAGYVLLAATVTVIENAIPGFNWDSFGDGALSVLKAVFLILAVGSWPALVIYPYESIKQRPEARVQVATFCNNTLVPVVLRVLV